MKYGLKSFLLIILEVIGKTENDSRLLRLEREDYYLLSYLPEYNILEKGTSSLNYKHTIEARAKIRLAALKRDKNNIIYSKEFLYYKNRNKSGNNNPMYGKIWSNERRLLMSKPVYVYDSDTLKLLYSFADIKSAVKYLKIGYHTLKRCLSTGEVFKNKIYRKESFK